MLENESWSQPSEGVRNDSRDSDFDKQAMRLASNDKKINSHYMENTNMDPVRSDICANNQINAAMDNDHNLFANDREENESNDLFFVGWPDLVTLEDADCIFRSIDSTFGCGEFGHQDEFSWLSSQCIDGSADAVPFNFSTVNPSDDDNSMMISDHNKQTKILNQSECNGFTTLSFPYVEEFSNVSNGVAPIDSCFDLSFEAPAKSFDDNSKKLRYGYFNDPNCMDATSYDPTLVSTQVCCSEDENHGEVEGAGEMTLFSLDSSNVTETSCLSFELDATSLEASRLCQLQQVMHQLDTRTKLCLRDGLYRLAKSADQRHSSTRTNGRSTCGDTNGVEGTKECSGLMDMETGTNPVDRSIAHLLFHRPTDPSAKTYCDGSSLNSHTIVDAFIQSIIEDDFMKIRASKTENYVHNG